MIGRASRMLEALRDWPRQRVKIDELWRIFDEVDPATRTSVQRRQLLADALTELATAGYLSLPGQRSYESTEYPPLPNFVNLPRPQAAVVAPVRVAWHPTLAWADSAALTLAQHAALMKINDWLFTDDRTMVVPVRERSLEILGDEKALDQLQMTDLFAPGRLTFGLLATRRVAPPFHAVRVSGGHTLLVIENSDTFDSLRTALQSRPGRVGLVGWGAGAAFTGSVLSLDAAAEGITDIAYFGDLDRNGLQVPATASRVVAANALPPVRPAVWLYEALRHVGREQHGRPRVDDETASSLADWLDPRHRAWASGLLRSGVRLAQEAVGTRHLTHDDRWRFDLT
jgi:hypothetical protein